MVCFLFSREDHETVERRALIFEVAQKGGPRNQFWDHRTTFVLYVRSLITMSSFEHRKLQHRFKAQPFILQTRSQLSTQQTPVLIHDLQLRSLQNTSSSKPAKIQHIYVWMCRSIRYIQVWISNSILCTYSLHIGRWFGFDFGIRRRRILIASTSQIAFALFLPRFMIYYLITSVPNIQFILEYHLPIIS